MALSFLFRHRLPFPELQTLSGAGGDAGGFQPLVKPIHAIIAFNHFADFRLPLRRSPGAGGDAGFAADTEVVVDKDDAVAGPLLHGAGGAGGDAPGILAMKAEHEDEGGSRQSADQFRADLDDLAQTGARRQALIGFALDLTGMAADAFAGILGEMVPAHENSPLGKSSTRHKMSPHGTRAPSLQVPYQSRLLDLVSRLSAMVAKKANDSMASAWPEETSWWMRRGMVRRGQRDCPFGATSEFRRQAFGCEIIIMKTQGKIK
jgi:hypothetical protein